MRLIKMSGVAMLAAIATMALVGASPAMAENTALCKALESPCHEESLVTAIHMELTEGTVWRLGTLEPELIVLCLKVLLQATVGELGSPQKLAVSELVFKECGTNKTHDNCTVEATQSMFEADLLKTALNLGEFEFLEIDLWVRCTILKVPVIDCKYNLKGVPFHFAGFGGTNKHGMLREAPTVLEPLPGQKNCPIFSEIFEGLLEPLTDVYVAT